uniref:Uncharacterized protein n=1 Tax=Dicentrarchus labrax TaxID=13489 RepID=A0A8C4E6Y1_DICLA
MLPCWLNPPQNAEGLEVRWYRNGNFDSPIMLYRAKKFQNVSQESSYRGRISFGLKDSASGGLKEGDVSLKLENARLQDVGDYSCYVSSDQGYDSATISLSVTNTGTPPLLSVVWLEDNMVNVSCESGGWYPEPSLRWMDQKQDLSAKKSNDSSVEFTLLFHLERHTKIQTFLLFYLESGSSAGGWVAFALLLIAVLAGLGMFFFKNKHKYPIFGTFTERRPGLRIFLMDKRLPVSQRSKEDAPKCLGGLELRVRESSLRGQILIPTASDGFWFLSSSPDSAERFQFSTQPKVLLPVSSRPQKVGVFLDYDRGELSFYNVEQERLIGSLTAQFTGEVFPLFNPGKNDKAPMEILHKPEQGPSTDMGNSAESAAP